MRRCTSICWRAARPSRSPCRICRCCSCWRILNNVIPFSLIFLGQTALGAGLASVLNATTPFWTIVIANAVTSDEKLSWNKVLGVLFGIAGTAVMIGPG